MRKPIKVYHDEPILHFECKKCGQTLTSGKAVYCPGCNTNNPEIVNWLISYDGKKVEENHDK